MLQAIRHHTKFYTHDYPLPRLLEESYKPVIQLFTVIVGASEKNGASVVKVRNIL